MLESRDPDEVPQPWQRVVVQGRCIVEFLVLTRSYGQSHARHSVVLPLELLVLVCPVQKLLDRKAFTRDAVLSGAVAMKGASPFPRSQLWLADDACSVLGFLENLFSGHAF
jgi:hypothetical protein